MNISYLPSVVGGATVVGDGGGHFGHLLQCSGNGIKFRSASSQHTVHGVQSLGIGSCFLSSFEQHLLSGFFSGLYLN